MRRLRSVTITLVLAITTRMLIDVAAALLVIHVTGRALQHVDGGVLLHHWRLHKDRLNADAQWRPVNN